MKPQQILAKLEQSRSSLKNFGVIKIGLFGSFLKGKATPRSDMDFLVEFEDATFDKYMDCKFFLEELFGRKVDLVIEHTLKPVLSYVREEALYAKIA